jgi:signal transduction protein with GAF and PtsI domain
MGQQLHRMQALLDAARLLNSTLELKGLTQIILDVVLAEVPVERLSVFVVDGRQNALRSLVIQGVENLEFSLPMGSGIAGVVAATGEILDIADAYADPRFERRFDEKPIPYHDLSSPCRSTTAMAVLSACLSVEPPAADNRRRS